MSMHDDLYLEGKRLIKKLQKLDDMTGAEYEIICKRIGEINKICKESEKTEAEIGWMEQLNKAKLEEMNKPFWKRDGFIQSVISGATSIGGILIVTNFEKIGNLTSRAVQFIKKPR